MVGETCSVQTAQAHRLKQVVDQAAAHFSRCFGQPREPRRTQSLLLPNDPVAYSVAGLSTDTDHLRDLEKVQGHFLRAPLPPFHPQDLSSFLRAPLTAPHETRRTNRRRMADRERVRKEAAISSVFPEPRQSGSTIFRMSSVPHGASGSVKLALEDGMLHSELLCKVQLNNPAGRCQSVSPFPDRKQASSYARAVDSLYSHQVANLNTISAHSCRRSSEAERPSEGLVSSCAEADVVSRKRRLQLTPLNHKPSEHLVESAEPAAPLPRRPALPVFAKVSRRVTGKCYLGLEDGMGDSHGFSSWFMNGTQ